MEIHCRCAVAQHPDAILILEHFADNTEEKELANYGFMLWGNMNYNYNRSHHGLGVTAAAIQAWVWASWKNRGFDDPHNVVYAESHDEERLMYRNISFGNASNPDQIAKTFIQHLPEWNRYRCSCSAYPDKNDLAVRRTGV